MKTQVLDFGYCELIEHWGSDERVIEAARMSTGKGFQGWGPKHAADCPASPDDLKRLTGEEKFPRRAHMCKCDFVSPGDEKLLRYLYENAHSTPFEMAGMVIEVQAPIFVFRMRHRSQSFNEMSARYTPLPDLNYVPTVERLMINAGGTNKQAGTVAGSQPLTTRDAVFFQEAIEAHYRLTEQTYQNALLHGIPKELARILLPVGRYSRMRASANLRNWLAFLTLRLAPNAQWEIRQYAEAVYSLVKERFPRTAELFGESRG